MYIYSYSTPSPNHSGEDYPKKKRTEKGRREYKCRLCGDSLKYHICPKKTMDSEAINRLQRRKEREQYSVKKRNRLTARGSYKTNNLPKYKCKKCRQEKGHNHQCMLSKMVENDRVEKV